MNILAKLLFLPPPKMKIYLFLPCFPATKNSQSCKVRPRLARSAENFEYLVLILAKMIINGRKTGKKRPNRARTGKISGFHFSGSALFLPCFLETLFLPHPGGGGYWPKYLPLASFVREISGLCARAFAQFSPCGEDLPRS